jgi:O-antigen ligase
MAVIYIIANFAVLPYLQSFTGGTLGARFANTDTSGRIDIVLADLEIWRDHPIFGIGPGMAKGTRSLYYERAGDNGAHTEFTRLLSEHGALGFFAFLVFIYAGLKNLKQARGAKAKGLVVAMMAWSILYMTNAAMRLVAPAFAFGLTFATFLLENKVRPLNRKRRLRNGITLRKRLIRDRVDERRPLTGTLIMDAQPEAETKAQA